MIHLRPARSTDAGKIGAILTEFAATTDWMPDLHTGAEDIAHAGGMIDLGWVTVAEVQGAVCGFAARDGDELNALYVAQSHRGQGVGSALLEDQMSRTKTLSLWTFEANGPAQDFYRKHGFREVERTDGAGNDENLPDIRLEWRREAN